MSNSASRKSFPEKRSALRAPVPVDVVLRCPDKSGKSFIEKTRTVDISRTGARTTVGHEVSHGTRLQMAVPHRKRKSWATIARIGSKSGNQLEIGIALDDTNDFWGVRMPEEAGEAARKGNGANGNAGRKETKKALELAQELLASATRNPPAEEEEDASVAQAEVRAAIEQYTLEALQLLNDQTAAMMRNLQELIARQTEEHLSRCVEAAVQQVEEAARDVTNRSRPVWEERIRSATDSAQEQLRARLKEHEATLATSAVKARRDLARKLADLSSAVAED
jgi:hypothetical protein